MTNDKRNPKLECRKILSAAFAGFVIRILSFVIRICEERFMESQHEFDAVHWDHELLRGDATCLESRLQAACRPKARRRQVWTG